jgi:nucleoside 2-deoxyribosyltransferase
MSDKCPICSNDLLGSPHEVFATNGTIFSCPNCGRFELAFESTVNLRNGARSEPEDLALLSHKIRSMSESPQIPQVSWELIESILRTSSLPSPPDQVNNLLLWLGERNPFGKLVTLTPVSHLAIVGALDLGNFVAVVSALVERGLLRGTPSSGGAFAGQLTLAGWQAYAEVKRGRPDSRRAFMAMPYGDEVLDGVFTECLRPAVAATGFELFRLNDAAPAGLIDDRLRVEIRRSRFLVADLTGANRGAYWEAGFAEGLGKPVIYTCEEGHFKSFGTHFDTSHHQTVLWTEKSLGCAAEALKTTIRATLPAEAAMQDADEEGSKRREGGVLR